MKTHELYDILRNSPLAYDEDAVSLEEVAIWLDMNFNTTSCVINILKAIKKYYHNLKFDRRDTINANAFPIVICSMNSQLCKMQSDIFISDKVLCWMFKTISYTDVLDDAVLNKRFLDFATKERDRYREKVAKHKKLCNEKISFMLPLPSKTNADLYEIFAELVDIVEDKMNRSK